MNLEIGTSYQWMLDTSSSPSKTAVRLENDLCSQEYLTDYDSRLREKTRTRLQNSVLNKHWTPRPNVKEGTLTYLSQSNLEDRRQINISTQKDSNRLAHTCMSDYISPSLDTSKKIASSKKFEKMLDKRKIEMSQKRNTYQVQEGKTGAFSKNNLVPECTNLTQIECIMTSQKGT
jgi:hypothetical protein